MKPLGITSISCTGFNPQVIPFSPLAPLPSHRLRDVLAEKERECQALMHQALHGVHAETRAYALASEPPGEQTCLGNGEYRATSSRGHLWTHCLTV